MLWVKVVVLLLLLAAVVSLFTGLMALVKGKGGRKTANALTWRVIFCVLAFGLLLLSKHMGWIEVHDVNPTKRYGVPIEALKENDAPPSP